MEEYASTVVSAFDARSAVGHKSASTVVGAFDARSAVGQEYASMVVSALIARSAVGHRYASIVVGAEIARSATRRNSRLVLFVNAAISAVCETRCYTIICYNFTRNGSSSPPLIVCALRNNLAGTVPLSPSPGLNTTPLALMKKGTPSAKPAQTSTHTATSQSVRIPDLTSPSPGRPVALSLIHI